MENEAETEKNENIPKIVDDDDEGLMEVSSPECNKYEEDSEDGEYRELNSSRQPFDDPNFLDYNSWKASVGGLIRHETHVLMESDEDLRAAITRAMFLEKASENLVNKRKRQIELLNEFRLEEGEVAKKLFTDVQPVLRLRLGPRYNEIEANLNLTFAKSQQPLFSAPDTSRPPPDYVSLPSMNQPPPALPKETDVIQMETKTVKEEIREVKEVKEEIQLTPINTIPKPQPLMSQHLLPPVIESSSSASSSSFTSSTPQPFVEPFTRSEEHENNQKVHEKNFQRNVPPSIQSSFRPYSVIPRIPSDSWRKPFLLQTPLPPPPSPFRIDSPILRFPPFRGAAHLRGGAGGPSLPPIPPIGRGLRKSPALRGGTGNKIGNNSSRSPRSSGSSSPGGLVGVNIHGLFVGNGTSSEFRRGSVGSDSGYSMGKR